MLEAYRDQTEWANEVRGIGKFAGESENLDFSEDDDHSVEIRIEEAVAQVPQKLEPPNSEDFELRIPLLDVECVTAWEARIANYSDL